MKKTLLFVCLLTVVCAAAWAASNQAPTDPIAITAPDSTKPLKIKFDHTKHQKFDCVRCHHDYQAGSDGEFPKDHRGGYDELPVNEWSEGDPVQPCLDCHPDVTDRKEQRALLTDPAEVRSLEDAAHDKCRDCHRELRTAPDGTRLKTSCSDCHQR
jgi:hypothetical protein